MPLPRAAAGALLALVVLGGCGTAGEAPRAVMGEAAGPGQGASASTRLLEAALLTTGHLGRGFVAVPDEEDEGGDSDLGCLLTSFEEITGGGEDDEGDDDTVDGSWAPDVEPQLPFVGQVLVPAGEEEARAGVEAVAASFDDCTEVDTTDADGAHLVLEVRTDTEPSDGADQQVNVVASGTMSVSGLELPFLFEIRMAAVGDTVVGVFLGNVSGPDPSGAALMDAAVERLVAVQAGDAPPEPRPLLEGTLPDLGAATA